MRLALQNRLSSYINALRPIIYINHFDHHLADELIASVADGASSILDTTHKLGGGYLATASGHGD